jgi:nucleotide-binding universal stress UspA family protein
VGQVRRPIVVAVDGSEASLRAAEWAAREAVRRTAPLRIVSVPGLLPRVRASAASSAAVANALRGIAARSLAAAVERVADVAPGAAVDTGLLAGPPAAAIVGSAADAGLLVVGARGAGGSAFLLAQTSRAALLLGSVSGYVAAYAPCPAVVVREETAATRREVVVGVRDADDADAALGFAFEEAALRGANLTAVHATSWRTPASLSSPAGPSAAQASPSLAATAAAAEATERQHIKAVLRAWQQKYPEVSVAEDVVRCHPAHVLASLSARADLVVIGRHGTAGAGVGSSVRHAVLSHAHGPVAIVPATD